MSTDHDSTVRVDKAASTAMTALFYQGRWLIHIQSLLQGLGQAAFYPLLGLYLANDIGVEPIYIGSFVTVSTLAGVIASQILGKKSDNGMSRKAILIASSIAWIVLTLALALMSNYWLILIVAIPLSAISAVGFAQLFAFASSYSDGKHDALFISVVRAQVSLAWVVGPPLAFILADRIGIRQVMLCGTGIYLLATFFTLPLKEVTTKSTNTLLAKQAPPIAAWLFAMVMVCISTANLMYLINMPLYLINEQGLFASAPGILMGVTAGLEIPLMIAAGIWVGYLGATRLLLMGSLAALVFFPLFAVLTDFVSLLLIQIFNAFMIAVFFTTGISYLQSLMPHQPGYAATLHTDAFRVGTIIAGILGGIVAQYTSYHSVLYACSLVALLSFVLMLFTWHESTAG